VRLQFRGSDVPPPGARLLADEKEVGSVTSAAFSPRLGRAIGMSYVRTEFSKAGSMLRWSGGEAEVT
jgi:glycine cleavage system aminomethyltransferase T